MSQSMAPPGGGQGPAFVIIRSGAHPDLVYHRTGRRNQGQAAVIRDAGRESLICVGDTGVGGVGGNQVMLAGLKDGAIVDIYQC